MADLPIKRIFVCGETADPTEFGVIGSWRAGNPQRSKDLEEIQSLLAYRLGLNFITEGGEESDLPFTPELQSLFYLITSQLANAQRGVLEFGEDVDYYKGSMVKFQGKLYVAKRDVKNYRDPTTSSWKEIVPVIELTKLTNNLREKMFEKLEEYIAENDARLEAARVAIQELNPIGMVYQQDKGELSPEFLFGGTWIPIYKVLNSYTKRYETSTFSFEGGRYRDGNYHQPEDFAVVSGGKHYLTHRLLSSSGGEGPSWGFTPTPTGFSVQFDSESDLTADYQRSEIAAAAAATNVELTEEQLALAKATLAAIQAEIKRVKAAKAATRSTLADPSATPEQIEEAQKMLEDLEEEEVTLEEEQEETEVAVEAETTKVAVAEYELTVAEERKVELGRRREEAEKQKIKAEKKREEAVEALLTTLANVDPITNKDAVLAALTGLLIAVPGFGVATAFGLQGVSVGVGASIAASYAAEAAAGAAIGAPAAHGIVNIFKNLTQTAKIRKVLKEEYSLTDEEIDSFLEVAKERAEEIVESEPEPYESDLPTDESGFHVDYGDEEPLDPDERDERFDDGALRAPPGIKPAPRSLSGRSSRRRRASSTLAHYPGEPRISNAVPIPKELFNDTGQTFRKWRKVSHLPLKPRPTV